MNGFDMPAIRNGRPESATRGALDVFFFQAEDGIRDLTVTGVQTCALPIWKVWSDLQTADALTEACKSVSIVAMPKYDSSTTITQMLERSTGTQIPGDDKHLKIGRASCRERV